jgi:hypothetical protein
LDRRLGGPQSRSGNGVEEKNSQPPPGIEYTWTSPGDETHNHVEYVLMDKRNHSIKLISDFEVPTVILTIFW